MKIKCWGWSACVLGALFIGICVAGWITNVIWAFHQTSLEKVILGIFAAFLAPIGVIHGIMLWF